MATFTHELVQFGATVCLIARTGRMLCVRDRHGSRGSAGSWRWTRVRLGIRVQSVTHAGHISRNVSALQEHVRGGIQAGAPEDLQAGRKDAGHAGFNGSSGPTLLIVDPVIELKGKAMKWLIIFAVVLLCAACSPVVVKINASDIKDAKLVRLSDVRPESERKQKIFSLLITSKEYGIVRVGDNKFTPSPITLLRDKVYKKFSVTGHLPKVVVYHFVIYANGAESLRRGAAAALCSPGCGLINALLVDRFGDHDAQSQVGLVNERTFESLSYDEYRRALYLPDEDPAGSGSVYVVYIETKIDGKKVFTRTVVPSVKGSGRNALPEAVERAIDFHLSHYRVRNDSSLLSGSNVGQVASPERSRHVAASGSLSSQPGSGTTATSPIVQAQGVANYMGCGAVQSNGNSTFVASCGSYSVLIGCDGDQCRPLHTVQGRGAQ